MEVSNVAASIAAAAVEAGTRFVFGVPGGGSNLDLVHACEQAGLDFVLCHTEAAATIMAATVGELSGAPGLALATRGPGAMSAVNAVAHAHLDRAPLVLVTDAVGHDERPRISHQYVDHQAVFTATAKASWEIDASNAPEIAAAAFSAASSGRWGPVHLDTHTSGARGMVQPALPPEPLNEVLPSDWLSMLSASARPLLLLGVGARAHQRALYELLATTQVPYLATYKAKGLIEEADTAFAGVLTGATIESDALQAADLIICIGMDPVELIPAPWRPQAPVLSVCEWSIPDLYIDNELKLVGNIAQLLVQLQPFLHAWDVPSTALALRERLEQQRPSNPDGITPSDLVTAVTDASSRETIATVDAGAHMLVTMPLWPGRALISSGLATMGFALPAAIAAALATEARIVCFTGDGGLGMCLAELETLARRELDVLVVVFNDATLSLIDIKQRHTRGGAAVTYNPIDFAAVAEGLGMTASRIRTEAELNEALETWRQRTGPLLLDVKVDPSEYPQIMKEVRGV